MHQQIRTSPGDPEDNLRRVLRALAGAQVNIEGIGPELETSHLRTVVPHGQWGQAKEALAAEGFEPTDQMAITKLLDNQHGALFDFIEQLKSQGYVIDSVLVLASRPNGKVLVSVGVSGTIEGWAAIAVEQGGWEEPDGWAGEDCLPTV